MKAIEKDMLNAMAAGQKHWNKDNTRAEREWVPVGSRWTKYTVYLHGNCIATVWLSHNGAQNSLVYVDYGTLREYPTVTTKSRLRALGVNVYTKAYTTYVDDTPIN